jgi:hypothetical protein
VIHRAKRTAGSARDEAVSGAETSWPYAMRDETARQVTPLTEICTTNCKIDHQPQSWEKTSGSPGIQGTVPTLVRLDTAPRWGREEAVSPISVFSVSFSSLAVLLHQ